MNGKGTTAKAIRRRLDELYRRYNRREFVRLDPVGFLYRYDDALDREIAGLIASSLAFGRVAQIHRSVARVLDRMESPAAFVEQSSPRTLRKTFSDFKHRYATGQEMAELVLGAKRVIAKHGSLRACFESGLREEDETVLPALTAFADRLSVRPNGNCNRLLPLPCRGSACKRLHLFLRWMVRNDEVDPGGWDAVSPSKLIVPLDIHMYRISMTWGFTERRSADGRTALEVTSAFRGIRPEDPVRYDFVLTHLGISRETPTLGN